MLYQARLYGYDTMKLVDADKLPVSTVGIVDAQGNFYGAADVVFTDDIQKAEAVTSDTVKRIVRCKDCKFRGNGQCRDKRKVFCLLHKWARPRSWWCADGKLRESSGTA